MIPLLLNHDHTRVIGNIVTQEDRLIVRFLPEYRMTKEQLFAIFGESGLVVRQQVFVNETALIEEVEILEWSLVV